MPRLHVVCPVFFFRRRNEAELCVCVASECGRKWCESAIVSCVRFLPFSPEGGSRARARQEVDLNRKFERTW